MPLCNSALTYSSSSPGNRDTAAVLSCTVLMESTAALGGDSAVWVGWLMKPDSACRVRSDHSRRGPVRAAEFAPGERPGGPILLAASVPRPVPVRARAV